MKPCIHSAGKRTLHPNSTLLSHVHFLSSVLSRRVLSFKVFLVFFEQDKRGYVRSLFCMAGLCDTFDKRKCFYLFPIIRVYSTKFKENKTRN